MWHHVLPTAHPLDTVTERVEPCDGACGFFLAPLNLPSLTLNEARDVDVSQREPGFLAEANVWA